MRILYRNQFEFDEKTASLEAVSNACLDWLFLNKRRPFPSSLRPDYSSLETSAVDLGKDNHLEILVNGDGESKEAIGIQYSHPDRYDDTIRWVAENTIRHIPGSPVIFACCLKIGRIGKSLIPVQTRATRPNIVPAVLEKFDCLGHMLPLKPSALEIHPEERSLEIFQRFLESPSRRLPIVFVSPSGDGSLYCDVAELAKQLAGIAHVICARDPQVCWRLGKVLPENLNTFAGSIRTYWPQFQSWDSPRRHPLLSYQTVQRLQKRHDHAVADKLLRSISQATVYSNTSEFFSWEDLLSQIREKEIQKAREVGDLDRIVDEFLKERDSYRESRDAALEEAERLSEELASAQQQGEYWRNEYIALKKQRGGSPSEGEEKVFPEVNDVLEAILIAEEQFEEQLIFSLNSKSNESTPYKNPSEVLDALTWLATSYRDAKMGVEHGGNLDDSIKKNVEGWFYSGGQSEVTARNPKYRSWYECSYGKDRHLVLEHIGRGSNTDPRLSVRIGFKWLEEEEKVLIGFVGQHQRNRAS